jgi:membrane protease YdiL (CAAX protease family)
LRERGASAASRGERAELTAIPGTRAALVPVLVGCALMFAVLQFGPGWLMQWLDQSGSAIVAAAAMLAVALALERAFHGRGPAAAWRALGWGAPRMGALAVAAILALAMLAFFPLFAAATGAQIALRPDWRWLLLGAVALNGLGEESLFRGYVFGGLRREGYSFTAAATVSLVIFAAVHLFLFIGNPPVVGFLGTLIAIAAAFPLAFLYERGGNTIWAPALFHVATHSIRFVAVSEPHASAALTAWLVLQLAVPFGVFLFARLLRPAGAPSAW